MLIKIPNYAKYICFYSNPYFILLVSSASILSMIISLLCGFKFCEYRDMTPALSTKIYLESATVLFISTIPAMIDALIDTSQMRKVSLLSPSYVGRLLIAVACFLSATQFKFITEYASIFGITKDPSLSYVCTLYSLRVLLVCSMLLILNLSNPTIFKKCEVCIINLLSCLSTVLRFYSIGEMSIISHLAAGTTVITFASIIYFYTVWIYRPTTTIKVITVNDYTSILYFITVTIIAITAYTPLVQHWLKGHFLIEDATNYTPSNLALVNYGLTILAIILNIVPGRIARYEAYVYMNNNIKTKTEYVRFISHELRTPLNSVFLGLNLSISQIPEHSNKDEDKERRDTLMEIASACSAALDILNQLLFFDKLDNGILELNKSKTRVTELMYDALKMFTVQIREKNIELKIQNNSADMPLGKQSGFTALLNRLSPHLSTHFKAASDQKATGMCDHRNLYVNEMIDIDKNKVIQVIRNIVSNAIKFTPEYGQISINLKFETNLPVKNRLTSQLADSWNEPQLSEGSSGINTTTSVSPIDDTTHILKLSSEERCMLHASCNLSTLQSVSSQSYSPMTVSHKTHISSEITLKGETNDEWNMDTDNTLQVYGSNIEGYLVIEVTDTGAGITEENQQKLFKQIVQFNPEILQNGGGSGLGMWISKGIVDLHGGKISVHSKGEGRGSTFTVKLPMTRIYDESMILSHKLCECKHISDHIASIQIDSGSALYHQPSCTNSTKDIQISMSSNASAEGINGDVKDSDNDDLPDDINCMELSHTTPSMQSLVSECIIEQSNSCIQDSVCSSSCNDLSSTEAMSEMTENLDPIDYMVTSSYKPLIVDDSNTDICSSVDPLNKSIIVTARSSMLEPSDIIHNTLIKSSPCTNNSNADRAHSKAYKLQSPTPNLHVTDISNSTLQVEAFVTTQRKLVLVVDDSSMNRKMLCRLLKSSGYECIEANDGVEAVTHIRDNCHCSEEDGTVTSFEEDSVVPSAHDVMTTKLYLHHDSSYKSTKRSVSHAYVDCIIMDFMMPNMDGPTATAEIRKLGYTGPIIGATGNALQADIDYFIEKGANQVLIKPLDMTSLFSAVSHL